MRIALIGHGAMGNLVESLVAKTNDEIAVIVTESHAHLAAEQLGETLAIADVAIDFSTAEAVRRNVEACMIAQVPLVEGTTGWSADEEAIRSLVAEHNGAFIYGANFSIGVNLFYRVVEFASELFAKFPEYEVFIEEQHHSRKKDAPSGTALKLKAIVEEHIKKEFSVSATRAGSIPGTHRVGFDGTADQVLLEHSARTREGFAAGALLAADWMIGKRGFYEFDDVMDEICQNRLQ
jgi:4-hydroxy-tetrahydrodipicolinate reductase